MMKRTHKKLRLNKMTIDILDDKALSSVKGGRIDDTCTSCGACSNGCITCNTNQTQ